MTLRRSKYLGSIPAFFVCIMVLTGCSQQQAPTPPTQPQHPPTTPTVASQQATVEEIALADMMTLMIDLEDQFQLRDVRANQSGKTLIVRFAAPTITGDELYAGLAQIFAWLNEKIPSPITGIDLVFTIQNVDSMVIHAERAEIENWKAGKIDNGAFINTFKKTSLL